MSSKPIRPLKKVSDSDRQISDKPQRRSFSRECKKDILEQIESVRGERGAIGKILRREGLYASQVASWQEEAIKCAGGERNLSSTWDDQIKKSMLQLPSEDCWLIGSEIFQNHELLINRLREIYTANETVMQSLANDPDFFEH